MEYYVIDNSNSILENSSIILKDDLYKHLAIVLRKKNGDNVEITDGKGNIFECTIVKIDKYNVYCDIISRKFGLYEPDIKVRLFLSLLRNQNRFEFAVEKSVEVGVMEIVPVITKYTVPQIKFSESRYKRLLKIIKSAAGQSQRCILPVLHQVVQFSDMIDLTKENPVKIVMYEHLKKEENKHFKIQNKKVDLLIGPEGGFDRNEIKILDEQGWIKRSLGNRKVRSETAAIVSLFEIINH